MIKIKRAYEDYADDDGFRVLVDRLWPRGLSTAGAHIDLWLKDIAPTADLRKWFSHAPDRWAEFRRRYRHELGDRADDLTELKHKAGHGTVTLIYAAKDVEHNNAVVLKEVLDA